MTVPARHADEPNERFRVLKDLQCALDGHFPVAEIPGDSLPVHCLVCGEILKSAPVHREEGEDA